MKTIDEWLVEGVLGEGGMGMVYAVRHETTGERGALKLMKDKASVKAQKRFRRETGPTCSRRG